MTAPITGPFQRLWTIKGPPNSLGGQPTWVEGRRDWYRQRKPFDIPLFFSYYCKTINWFTGGDGTDYTSVSNIPVFSYSESQSQRLYNAVYEKFAHKVKEDAAELASTLATWTQARDMITDRATRLWKGWRAARKGDIRTLKALWGKGAGIRANLKAGGSHVLEYSFGWAPLVGDIAAACAVLGAGIPPAYVKVRQKLTYTATTNWQDRGALLDRKDQTGTIEWGLRSWVRVTNPNTLLLNELGLTNAASVLWEVTPWSFVVDYFVNVNAFIASFTDWIGLDLDRPNKTFFAKENTRHTGKYKTSGRSYSAPCWGADYVSVTRTTGIPGPTLALRLPWRMSMQRASTSIALLLQQLRK